MNHVGVMKWSFSIPGDERKCYNIWREINKIVIQHYQHRNVVERAHLDYIYGIQMLHNDGLDWWDYVNSTQKQDI